MRKSKQTLLLIDQVSKRLNLSIDDSLSDDIARLIRYSKKLRECFTVECNGYKHPKMTVETWKQFDERRPIELDQNEIEQNRLLTKIKEICDRNKLYYYIQPDPRGASLYIDIKPIDRDKYNYSECLY